MDTNRHESENKERRLMLEDEVANDLRIITLRGGVLLNFKHGTIERERIIL
jgi:hypothetical protein